MSAMKSKLSAMAEAGVAAARADNLEALQKLVSRIPRSSNFAHLLTKFLVSASGSGSVAVTAWLLSQGADPNGVPEGCFPPLPAACNGYKNQEEIVDLLLAAGADARYRSEYGVTALHCTHSVEVTSRLLAAGANPSSSDKAGWTPLHYAARLGGNSYWRRMDLLLAAGADVNARDLHGRTPLHMVATSSDGDADVRYMARAGAEIDARDDLGLTPFHYAVFSNGPGGERKLHKTAAALLALGANGAAAGTDRTFHLQFWLAKKTAFSKVVVAVGAGAILGPLPVFVAGFHVWSVAVAAIVTYCVGFMFGLLENAWTRGERGRRAYVATAARDAILLTLLSICVGVPLHVYFAGMLHKLTSL
jgi:ankyrin repeat protein